MKKAKIRIADDETISIVLDDTHWMNVTKINGKLTVRILFIKNAIIRPQMGNVIEVDLDGRCKCTHE